MPPRRTLQGRPDIPKIVVVGSQDFRNTHSTEDEDGLVTPRAQPQRLGLPLAISGALPTRPSRKRKRSASEADYLGSGTETEKIMSPKSPRHSAEPSGKRPSHSKNKAKSPKSDDWADVTDPEERRRIQNRIAQRKFREKTRENKERAEREAQNLEHAGRSYQIPSPLEMEGEEGDGGFSGLPWGGISMRHVVSRGHEYESRRGSSRGGYSAHPRDEPRALSPYSSAGGWSSAGAASGSSSAAHSGGGYPPHPSSFGGGSPCGEDVYYEDESPLYDYDNQGRPAGGELLGHSLHLPPTQQPEVEFQRIPSFHNPASLGFISAPPPPPPAPAVRQYDLSVPYDSASPSSSSVSSYGHPLHQGMW